MILTRRIVKRVRKLAGRGGEEEEEPKRADSGPLLRRARKNVQAKIVKSHEKKAPEETVPIRATIHSAQEV